MNEELAIDELRRMLDERGIEHDDYDPDPRYSGPTSDRKTEWDGASFREWPNGTIRFGAKGTTPAQAIAATVGAGTCHIETTESWLPAERYHRCKSCGAFFAVLNASHDIPPRVCPNCSRRVVGA